MWIHREKTRKSSQKKKKRERTRRGREHDPIIYIFCSLLFCFNILSRKKKRASKNKLFIFQFSSAAPCSLKTKKKLFLFHPQSTTQNSRSARNYLLSHSKKSRKVFLRYLKASVRDGSLRWRKRAREGKFITRKTHRRGV